MLFKFSVKNGMDAIRQGWKEYKHQPVLPASIAYVLLYFNIALAPGAIMTALLMHHGMFSLFIFLSCPSGCDLAFTCLIIIWCLIMYWNRYFSCMMIFFFKKKINAQISVYFSMYCLGRDDGWISRTEFVILKFLTVVTVTFCKKSDLLLTKSYFSMFQ